MAESEYYSCFYFFNLIRLSVVIKKASLLFLPIVLMFYLPGCGRIEPEPIHPEKEVFNFTITEAQRENINKSRGKSFEVSDPVPVLQYAGALCTLDRFEIRGESSLNFVPSIRN